MTSKIKDRFCPKCGTASQGDGLCNECRTQGTEWVSCDRRVVHTHCPSCGATKRMNTWTDSEEEHAKLAPELAKSAVHFHPDVKKRTINVASIRDISVNRSRAVLEITGVLYSVPVSRSCTVEIAWHREQCDRCNRITGSYYEGFVQVRAEERLPSPFEMQIAKTIATQLEESLLASGERLSYLSEMTETKDGLDITVGSQRIGLLIAQGITGHLGGRYTTHPKLVGEKNGKQLFRVTYLVRLPRYQKHDVVRIGKVYAEVEQVETSRLRIFDLAEGRSKSVRNEEISRRVGNARLAQSMTVTYISGDMIGILDPETCATNEIRKVSWMETAPGHNIRVLRDGDHLIPVR